MVKVGRKKRSPIKKTPPVQPIPKEVVKGLPVLYMLQRVDYHHAILVDCVVTSKNKVYEKYLLELFRDKAFRMTSRVRPPGWFSQSQVKFGITSNLPKRLEDINEDIFESGVTEWRKLSHAEMILAHNKFWWYRNGSLVQMIALFLLCAVFGWIYLITNN